MGSWGETAHKSVDGFDLFAVAARQMLQIPCDTLSQTMSEGGGGYA